MKKWLVTYEVVTYESAEFGETDDQGIVDEYDSFRDALHHAGYFGFYPRESDTNVDNMVCCFTDDKFNEDYRTGATESRSLHIPAHITPSSRARIARYLTTRR